MARYAVLNDSTLEVDNVIEWNGQDPYEPPTGHSLIQNDYVAIGDYWRQDLDDFLRPLQNIYS